MMDQTYAPPLRRKLTVSRRSVFPGVLLLLCIGAFLAPGAPFIIDGGIYTDMAKAMAERGAFDIGGNGGVDGAPALTKFLTDPRNGFVYPQYPSGYAVIAAPFYMAFGIHGLMLMNALSFGACLFMTFRLAERFYDARIGAYAAAIFAVATFAPVYVFPVWPHMLALVFWLAAFTFAAQAEDIKDRKAFYIRLLLAGAAIGAGINIRIDIFLAAIALFVWLRCFARPEDRLAPLALAVGAAPGLLLAAWFNAVKFGAFMPFSYNSTGGGGTDISRYTVILAVAGAVMAALWAFNARKIFLKARSAYGVLPLTAGLAGALALALLIEPLRDLVWRMTRGVYVLVVNLQAHGAYYQEGVERNEFGQLLFWDYPKKALLQSLPYLPLIALPVFHALRRKNTSRVALCLLAIAAPVAFYALNEWHGGGSYNMRYFTPALPFIATLSAAALGELMGKGGGAPERQTLLIIVAIAAFAYFGMQELAQSSPRLLAPASLYPQWLIAGLLALAIGIYLYTEKYARLALHAGLAALAYAGALNLYEEIGHEKAREEQRVIARDASAPIPEGALVLTQLPILLMPAEARGAFVMVGTEKTADQAAQAAAAFLAAGRCVYFHNPAQVRLIAPRLAAPVSEDPLWAPSRRYGEDPRLAFFTFESQREACAF